MDRFDYDVFLSFASLNESLARPLYERLTGSGLRVFWSDETLKGRVGESWYKVIESSLESSKHFVLLWSPEAKKSKFVELEYKTFHSETIQDDNRLLIPVIVNGYSPSHLPLFLRQMQGYPLDGNLGDLITRLGGRYEPLEVENARLRKELSAARQKITDLEQSDRVPRTAHAQLQADHEALKKRYAALENQFADVSVRLQKEEEKTTALSDRLGQLNTVSTAPPKSAPRVKSPAKTFTDEHGIEFILIEPGTFMMGSETGEYGEMKNRFTRSRSHSLTIWASMR